MTDSYSTPPKDTRFQREQKIQLIANELNQRELVSDPQEASRRKRITEIVQLALDNRKGWAGTHERLDEFSKLRNADKTFGTALSKLGISRPTFFRYKDQLRDNGKIDFDRMGAPPKIPTASLGYAAAAVAYGHMVFDESMSKEAVFESAVKHSRQKKGLPPLGSPPSDYVKKKTLERLKKFSPMPIGFSKPNVKTQAQIDADIDLRNPVAHAVGMRVVLTKYREDGSTEFIPGWKSHFLLLITSHTHPHLHITSQIVIISTWMPLATVFGWCTLRVNLRT